MDMRAVDHGLDVLQTPDAAPRAPGVHISTLYNSLYGALDPKRYPKNSPPNVVKMAMGLAWEAYLERVLVGAGLDARRPDPFTTVEGIPFSPDLLIFNGQTRLGEIKLTYMSEADALDDPKFAKWLTQAKAYCHHLEIPFVRFYVLFVNGDYRTNRNPSLRAYDIEFSARELQDNWTMLVNHGKQEGLL